MSASLVGSEMCIRDRPFPLGVGGLDPLGVGGLDFFGPIAGTAGLWQGEGGTCLGETLPRTMRAGSVDNSMREDMGTVRMVDRTHVRTVWMRVRVV
eukprot:15435850-Alexandrium_andersonii.AAC.2